MIIRIHLFSYEQIIFYHSVSYAKIHDPLNGEFYSLIMAAAVSAILPLVIVFIIGQKQVIEGIALGGVKG